MNPCGIALLGAGTIARCHLRAIREIPEARVAGVFSRTLERARELGEAERCFFTADAAELLGRPDVDLAVITTSSGSHAPLALQAIEAGKHVLVEKPMAMTAAQADEVVAAARRRGLVLSPVAQRRFEEQHQAVKRVLDEGRLGRLLLVEARCPYHRTQEYYDSADWRGKRSEDGGALMNQGIHSVDLMLWFAGPARAVSGKSATMTHRMESEDVALALVEFESGALGTLLASTSIRPGFPPTLGLYGERGTVRLEANAITHWTVPGVPMPDFSGLPSTVSGRDPKATNPRHHAMQIRDVVGAIVSGRPPAVTGEDGRRAVAFVEQALGLGGRPPAST